jgi:hypothetical protein
MSGAEYIYPHHKRENAKIEINKILYILLIAEKDTRKDSPFFLYSWRFYFFRW